jgi:hypothetical protein
VPAAPPIVVGASAVNTGVGGDVALATFQLAGSALVRSKRHRLPSSSPAYA